MRAVFDMIPSQSLTLILQSPHFPAVSAQLVIGPHGNHQRGSPWFQFNVSQRFGVSLNHSLR